jgi:hypothetical protein
VRPSNAVAGTWMSVMRQGVTRKLRSPPPHANSCTANAAQGQHPTGQHIHPNTRQALAPRTITQPHTVIVPGTAPQIPTGCQRRVPQHCSHHLQQGYATKHVHCAAHSPEQHQPTPVIPTHRPYQPETTLTAPRVPTGMYASSCRAQAHTVRCMQWQLSASKQQ